MQYEYTLDTLHISASLFTALFQGGDESPVFVLTHNNFIEAKMIRLMYKIINKINGN